MGLTRYVNHATVAVTSGQASRGSRWPAPDHGRLGARAGDHRPSQHLRKDKDVVVLTAPERANARDLEFPPPRELVRTSALGGPVDIDTQPGPQPAGARDPPILAAVRPTFTFNRTEYVCRAATAVHPGWTSAHTHLVDMTGASGAARWSSSVARRAHNPQVAGSNPVALEHRVPDG